MVPTTVIARHTIHGSSAVVIVVPAAATSVSTGVVVHAIVRLLWVIRAHICLTTSLSTVAGPVVISHWTVFGKCTEGVSERIGIANGISFSILLPFAKGFDSMLRGSGSLW